MLDLDLINEKIIEIKINKVVVKVNQPTFALAKKVRAYERSIATITEDEIYKQQEDILLEFLNNNSSDDKFKKEDIDKLTFSAIRALYSGLRAAIVGAETDPN